MNWNTVTLPRDRGGLGMVEMQSRNEAYLAKLCWRLANEQDAPWARVLMSKYFTDQRITEVGRKLPCSKTWVACKKGGPIFKSGLKWVIKNGASTNLWGDFWLPFGPLRSYIQGPLAREEAELVVVDIRDQGSNWFHSVLSFKLPEELYKQIQEVPFSLD